MTERDKLITQVALATGITLYMATRAVEIIEANRAAADDRWFLAEMDRDNRRARAAVEPRP